MSDKDAEPKEDFYAAIEDLEEHSISVLHTSYIVCDPKTVKIGDQVKYLWGKEEHLGVLRFITGKCTIS